MKFSTSFNTNAVFPAEPTGVENFCQILGALGTEYIEAIQRRVEKGTITDSIKTLNKNRQVELKKVLWEAKSKIKDRNITLFFEVPAKSFIFKKGNKEEVERLFKKAISLHWQTDKRLRTNDRDGAVNAYLDRTQIHYEQVFKEALANIKID